MSDYGLLFNINENNKRIDGILKHYYEDFHVREIDENGEIMHLTDIFNKKQHIETIAKQLEHEINFRTDFSNKFTLIIDLGLNEISKNVLKLFIGKLEQYKKEKKGEDYDQNVTYENIKSLIKNEKQKKKILEKMYCVLEFEKILDKKERTEIHQQIKKSFPFISTKFIATSDKLPETRFSDTLFESEHIKEEYCIISNSNHTYFLCQLQPEIVYFLIGVPYQGLAMLTDININKWTSDMPEHTHFICFKQNIDVVEAIAKIANALKIDNKLISVAGTKDRRAVTVQRMSIEKYSINKLKLFGSNFNKNQIVLGSAHYSNSRIHLGRLKGNNFNILIRDISNINSVDSIILNLKQFGFVNYFGVQRFGRFHCKTHEIGGLLFLKKYYNAAVLIVSCLQVLDYPKLEIPTFKSDNEKFADHPIKFDLNSLSETLKNVVTNQNEKLQKKNAYISLLKQMVAKPKNIMNHLKSFTKNMLSMYYHAFQSFIWNHMVSYRLKKFGHLNIVVGDFVNLSQVTNMSISNDTTKKINSNFSEDLPNTEIDIKVILSEDECKKYKIEDLSIPLVGPGIQIPPNLVEFTNYILRYTLGMNFQEFCDICCKNQLVNIYGLNRRVIERIDIKNYEVIDQLDKIMICSDLDIYELNQTNDQYLHPTKKSKVEMQDQTSNSYENQVETGIETQNKTHVIKNDQNINQTETKIKKALLLECNLSKSVYLTSALREILNEESLSKLNEY